MLPPTTAEQHEVVIAIDCSTTASKAVAVDAHGNTVATGRGNLTLSNPAPGEYEQSAEEWWKATEQAIKAVTALLGSTRIRALAITCQRETFVCLSGEEPIRPAMVWMDSRAKNEVRDLGNDRVHAISGRPADTTPSFYKLAWLRRHEPVTLDSADRIGDVSAYLNLRLTGQWASSRASADCTGMLDMVLGTWSRELCASVGVPIEKLPRIVDPGAAIGLVTDELAAELGLPAGLPVIAAAGDGQCAAVGAGVIAPGSVYLNMGTAEVCGTISEDYVWDRDYRTVVAASGNGYLLEAFLSSGTYLVNWFLDGFGTGTPASEQIADLEAALTEIGPGAEGLLALPYWHGAQTPYWDSAARGAVIGWTGTHTKAHFYRAILEGVAFEVKLQVEGLSRAVADKPTELLVTGGGSRSPIWAQIVADVLGRDLILCKAPETTALGAAMFAAVAVGIHADLPAAAAAMSRRGGTVRPDPAAEAKYAQLWKVYQHLYETLAPVYKALDAVPH
ncbi:MULTISPECIES: xylulokinase [unclassified Arthrobacter]|uniref:xylulokinase n=1 Tax=unclassified Arthrobacter TaxID=235627 RepID=UPI001EFF4ADC|nr:FGGY family carbohydrate kinase [Arthrobacter sp. FW305-BF8]UKA56210.1 hypothetical protein LFT45_10040 [Arthrobacter sp. FW305-BF8]